MNKDSYKVVVSKTRLPETIRYKWIERLKPPSLSKTPELRNYLDSSQHPEVKQENTSTLTVEGL